VNLDFFDVVCIILGISVIGLTVNAGGSLSISILLGLLFVIQHSLRRSAWFERFIDKYTSESAQTNQLARSILLPPPDETELTLSQTSPLKVEITKLPEPKESLYKQITKPNELVDSSALITGKLGKVSKAASDQQTTLFYLKKLPAAFSYTQLPNPPTKLAVPLGYDAYTNQLRWVDFGASEGSLSERVLHVLINGTTGSGKDNLLRLWYVTLTMNNTPDDVQFIVVDGKSDWLSQPLQASAHMMIPPAGGVELELVNGKWEDLAIEYMEKSFDTMFREITRRSKLFHDANVLNIEQYREKTGEKLPYIFFIASDVGSSLDKQMTLLVNTLISKGRSFGVRLIMSMQTPVGESNKWRGQLSMILSGHITSASSDGYIMGMPVDSLVTRPSALPNPQENPQSAGLFVGRRGSTQYLLKTPFLPENDWNDYIESRSITKTTQSKQQEDYQLLKQLLLPATKELTEEQKKSVIKAIAAGKNKTEIMIDVLKMTNGTLYKECSPAVDALIRKYRV
jgi:hypothetical protein